MLLFYTMYNSLSLHLPTLLQKKPYLRWWNHSSMPLSRTLFRVVGQAESCKCRYQVAKIARPCVLRDSQQSNLIYPAWLRVAKNARCCVQRGVVVRQNSTLIEKQLLFLKCCSSSGWIWTDQYSLIGLMVGVRHTWFALWDRIILCIY